ncbi:hypothetical protein HSBAA_44310 [Vreelandella sulfidaeris]|uniref:Uncharacterized protein n=1 Tax=Vreelandella sulfidaeris TaxID=115553 RepID=A0A455UAS9_9GAMM|nr:hypothetical protein HSBAA_44310 [Halomonas sulfidaeris]
MSRLVPEDLPYFRHTLEGPDDMPAHVVASLLGTQLTLAVRDGRLALGTWQGIWLGEHRNQAGPRRLLATLNGVSLANAGTSTRLSAAVLLYSNGILRLEPLQ